VRIVFIAATQISVVRDRHRQTQISVVRDRQRQ